MYTGSCGLFDFDFNQSHDGALYSLAYNRDSAFNFTADSNTTYALSGQHSVTDVTTPGRVYSRVNLYDVTNSTYLFRDINQSDNTLNESFNVGIFGEGDYYDISLGSASGNLIAGNQYQFAFAHYIQATPTADGGAAATGCITLSICGATGAGSCGSSVPEPMPLTLLGAGLAALGLRRRLRLKAA